MKPLSLVLLFIYVFARVWAWDFKTIVMLLGAALLALIITTIKD